MRAAALHCTHRRYNFEAAEGQEVGLEAVHYKMLDSVGHGLKATLLWSLFQSSRAHHCKGTRPSSRRRRHLSRQGVAGTLAPLILSALYDDLAFKCQLAVDGIKGGGLLTNSRSRSYMAFASAVAIAL